MNPGAKPVPPAEDEAGRDWGELAVGLFLLGVSLFFGYQAFLVDRPAGWKTAPGLLPLFASGVLFLLATVIVSASVRRLVRYRMSRNPFGSATTASFSMPMHHRRAATVAVSIAVFYFFLLQWLPFEVSASLFLAVMTWIFWPQAGALRRLVVSLAIPFLVSMVFQGMFGIPLPGDGSVVEWLAYRLSHGGGS